MIDTPIISLSYQRCLAEGLEITWPPTDMPWNVREMHVRHPDGHVLRIAAAKLV